jgi:hypothetical protein
MLPKLYEIRHPSTPYQVVFRDRSGRAVRRHFSIKADAERHHADLLAKAKIAGTAGLVLDAEMRAEYFAAKKALNGLFPVAGVMMTGWVRKGRRILVTLSDGTTLNENHAALQEVNGTSYAIIAGRMVPMKARETPPRVEGGEGSRCWAMSTTARRRRPVKAGLSEPRYPPSKDTRLSNHRWTHLRRPDWASDCGRR